MNNISPDAKEHILQFAPCTPRARQDVYDLNDKSFEADERWVGKPVLCEGRVVGKVACIIQDSISIEIDPAEREFVSAHFKKMTETPTVGVSSRGH